VVRRVRLISGSVPFVFVTTHLLNHALGLVSLEAIEAGRRWFLYLWRNPIGSLALYGAFAAHLGLAYWALYKRRHWRLGGAEWLQIALGFTLPFLLVEHIIGTRGAHELAGTNDLYAAVLLVHWKFNPATGIIQTVALLTAWIHGVIGLYLWLRLKPWYPRWQPLLYAGALLVPTLSVLGYADAGRAVVLLADDPAWLEETNRAIGWPRGETVRILIAAMNGTFIALGASLALTLAANLVRPAIERRRGVVRVSYPDGRTVSLPPGGSVLDASRQGGIPHASVCGGRGRCSTCRVRIVRGADMLPAPSPEESRVLARIGAPAEVRHACQLRPAADLAVAPLLPPTATARDGFARPIYLQGQEKDIAILFVDFRDFTKLSEKKLPYDVVFVLNRYFAGMGEAVTRAGGHLDKFIGDGVMALFGIESDARRGSREALAAARGMADRLRELNESLAHDLDQPLRIGIGIHVGPAIVGAMGYGRVSGVTAIGDAVNLASRLEALTKDYRCQLVISAAVASRAGLALPGRPRHQIEIRGRGEPVEIVVVEDARMLEPTGG